jgi:hypothetical protein
VRVIVRTGRRRIVRRRALLEWRGDRDGGEGSDGENSSEAHVGRAKGGAKGVWARPRLESQTLVLALL